MRRIQEQVSLNKEHDRHSEALSAITEVKIVPSLVASTSPEIIPFSKESFDNASSRIKNFNDLEKLWFENSKDNPIKPTVVEQGKSYIFRRAMRFKMPRPRLKFGGQSAALERAVRPSKSGNIQSSQPAILNKSKHAHRSGKTNRSSNTASKKHIAGTSQPSRFYQHRNTGFIVGRRRKTGRMTLNQDRSKKTRNLKITDPASNSFAPGSNSGYTSPSSPGSSPEKSPDSFMGESSHAKSKEYYGSYHSPHRYNQFDPNDFLPPPDLPYIKTNRGAYKSDTEYSSLSPQKDSSKKSFFQYETIGGDDTPRNLLHEKNNYLRDSDDRNAIYQNNNVRDYDTDAFDIDDREIPDMESYRNGGHGHSVGATLANAVVKTVPVLTSLISSFTSYDHPGHSQEYGVENGIQYDDNISNDYVIDRKGPSDRGKNRAGSSRIVRGRNMKNKLRKGGKNREIIENTIKPEGIQKGEEEESSDNVIHNDENSFYSSSRANSNSDQNHDKHEKRSKNELTEKFNTDDQKNIGIETSDPS